MFGLAPITVIVTLVHTIEEVHGRIWETLWPLNAFRHGWLLYYGFQLFVIALGVYAVMSRACLAVGAFVLIRLLDVIVTHYALRQPGGLTAILLLCDAGAVFLYYQGFYQ